MSQATATLSVMAATAKRELPLLRVVGSPSELENGSYVENRPPQADADKLVLTDDLAAEIRRESLRLESAEPQEILRWATERFGHKFTMATAFGPEGMVLIHMLAEIAPGTPIFNLDTGYQ